MFLWHTWNLVNEVLKVKEMYVWKYAHVHVMAMKQVCVFEKKAMPDCVGLKSHYENVKDEPLSG